MEYPPEKIPERDSYEAWREEERKKLVSYLKSHGEIKAAGLKVVTGGTAGKGRTDYTSRKRISVYDLSNWKWVEVKGENTSFDCVISLNMVEIDPGTGNIHMLYDRIGIFVEYKLGETFYQTQIYTNIDLPFDNDETKDDPKKRQIAQLILEQYEIFRKKGNEAP